MAGAGVELGRRGALAVAGTVVRPAVVHAAKPFAFDPAEAELHAAVRAVIDEGADLAGRGAEEDEVLSREAHADRLLPERARRQDRVPVVEDRHAIIMGAASRAA